MDCITGNSVNPQNREQRCPALALAFVLAGVMLGAHAQDRPAPLDVLELTASASSEVAADTAVVTVSVIRDGSDVAALTQDVDGTLNRALGDAKMVSSVTASSGGYSTQSRSDKGQTLGWTVHGDLILKSHDFGALSKLVGRLTNPAGGMQVSNTTFEVSSEQRQIEESDLISRAIATFKNKANVASKALGYSSWAIRQVRVGPVSTGAGPRMNFAAKSMMSSASVPMPLEPGRIVLDVEVSGSVQMRH